MVTSSLQFAGIHRPGTDNGNADGLPEKVWSVDAVDELSPSFVADGEGRGGVLESPEAQRTPNNAEHRNIDYDRCDRVHN